MDPLNFDTLNMMLSMMLLAGVIDKPYSMGIFETIIDVHFGGGLAVEFGDRDQDAPKVST